MQVNYNLHKEEIKKTCPILPILCKVSLLHLRQVILSHFFKIKIQKKIKIELEIFIETLIHLLKHMLTFLNLSPRGDLHVVSHDPIVVVSSFENSTIHNQNENSTSLSNQNEDSLPL